MGDERLFAFTATPGEVEQRQAVSRLESLQHSSQVAADFVPQQLFEWLTITSHSNHRANSPGEFFGNTLGSLLQGSVLGRLKIEPFIKQVAPVRLIGREITRKRLFLLTKRTELFNLAAQPDELLAIDLGLLQLTQQSLVRGLDRLLALIPLCSQCRQFGVSTRQHLADLCCYRLKLSCHAIENLRPLRQQRTVGQAFERLRRQKGNIDR